MSGSRPAKRAASVGISLYPCYPAAPTQALARLFEALGYSHVWVPDQRFNHDLAVVMAQVAMVTDVITIGSAVTDPYIRHAALTAQMMGSLDELSGGRIVVGLGTGLAGFRSLGIKPERPVRAMREAIELMRELWSGETVTYQGQTVTFDEGRLEYEPLRRTIPFFVAGRGPQVLSLAGRMAEGVMIGSLASPPGLAYAFQHIDRGLREGGRDRSEMTVAIWLHTAVAEDAGSAWQTLRPVVASVLASSRAVLGDVGLPIPASSREAIKELSSAAGPPDFGPLARTLDDETMRHFAMAGSPEDIGERVAELAASGIDHVAIVPWLVPGQTIEAFARSVAGAIALAPAAAEVVT